METSSAPMTTSTAVIDITGDTSLHARGGHRGSAPATSTHTPPRTSPPSWLQFLLGEVSHKTIVGSHRMISSRVVMCGAVLGLATLVVLGTLLMPLDDVEDSERQQSPNAKMSTMVKGASYGHCVDVESCGTGDNRIPRCRLFLLVATDGSGDFRKSVGGATIWTTNLAHMLLGHEGHNHIHVLSTYWSPKKEEKSSLQLLMKPGVTLLDPFSFRQCVMKKKGLRVRKDEVRIQGKRPAHVHCLLPKKLLSLLETLTTDFEYDAIILRDNPVVGFGNYVLNHTKNEDLRKRLVIFGLDREKDLGWEDIVPRYGAYQAVLSPIHFPDGVYSPEREGHDRHVLWFPPMISEVSGESMIRDAPMGQTICYIGSYPTRNTDYMIEDMTRGFRMMRRRSFPNATFLAVFTMYERATLAQRRLFQETEGFHILPPVSHEEAFHMYRHQCDLGVRGLRDDNRDVMSTKVLEMASQGLPMLINPLKIHDILFGEDYPLYWRYENPVESFAEVATKALEDPALYRAVSERVVTMANRFSYDSIFTSAMAVLPRR